MALRKQLIKIAVIFLSLFALASLLKFFNVKEGFSTSLQWHTVLKNLLNDANTFEYSYKSINYKIDGNTKNEIKNYIGGITKGVNFGKFTEGVGENILNNHTKGEKKRELSKLNKKKSAKQMIIQYAKKSGHGITGTAEKINSGFLQ